VIKLQHISKTFNPGTANFVNALVDVNLEIEPFQFVVMVGSNGSGKTTLLNAIAGSIQINEGKIFVAKNEITRLKEHQRCKWIARIFQDPLMGTAPGLSVLENFRLASIRTQSKKLTIRTHEKFKQNVRERISLLNLGLENKVDQLMGTLSGGQRQALTLLMAAMDDTKILLMDEPAAALDPKTSELLMKLAEKIIREFKLTAFLVTHQLKDALAYGNRLILMREGMITKDLNQSEKSSLQLNDLYNWF
jgi:putative ABC transport system ATP-binding protein